MVNICKFPYWMCVLSILLAVLIGCSNNKDISPDLMDKSPFTGIPCAAPCWHNLMVGESEESVVMSTLSTLTFIEQNSVRLHEMSIEGLDPYTTIQGSRITASCKQPSRQCLSLDIAGDILTRINIELNYEITLGQAIEYLGRPSYVGYIWVSLEQPSCEVTLVWSDRQLVLASKVFDAYNDVEANCGAIRDSGKPRANLLIVHAMYVTRGAIQYMLSKDNGQFFDYLGVIPQQ